MLNKEKILEIANKHGKITTRQLSSDFCVSRQYINQLLTDIIETKEIFKIGVIKKKFINILS